MQSILITAPKKGDLPTHCSNYTAVVLISHLSSILLCIILERLKPILEPRLSKEQAGFCIDRSMVQKMLMLWLLAEKYRERGQPVYSCFVHYIKAFDSVWHEGLWAVLKSCRVPNKLMSLLKNLYENSPLTFKVNQIGSRQADLISLTSFITLLERVVEMSC